MKKKTPVPPPVKLTQCFRCDGTGMICDTCGESENACGCDESAMEYGSSFSDCEDCGGTGE